MVSDNSPDKLKVVCSDMLKELYNLPDMLKVVCSDMLKEPDKLLGK